MKEQIKAIRKSLGKTQAEFAADTGKSRDTISNYELGRVIPDDSYAELLSIKYGYDVNWIKTGKGDPKKGFAITEEIGAFAADAVRENPQVARDLLHSYIDMMSDATAIIAKNALLKFMETINGKKED